LRENPPAAPVRAFAAQVWAFAAPASGPALPLWDQHFQFCKTTTETTDIQALQDQFPSALTPFATFLDETNWSDTELTYDDLKIIVPDKAALV
jgi:hypothetical protein